MKEESFEPNNQSADEVYEEFDISKFDFSIADPWEEAPQEAETPTEPPAEEPAEAPETPSFSEELLDLPLTPEKTPPAKEKRERSLPSFSFGVDKKTFLRKSRRYLRYALRPSGLYENISESLWWIFLLGCCLFGCAFYLLLGMDWASAGMIASARVPLLMLTGLLLGGTVSVAFAGGACVLAKLCKEDDLKPFRMISAVAGSAVYPAAVLLFGLFLGLFGLSVSMSFGVVALLWWIFNLMEMLKDLMGRRFFPILTFIILWSAGLFALITATFMLK